MKMLYLASILFVGAILFAGALRLQDTPTQPAPTTTTLQVIEHTSSVLSNLGAHGDSVGDMISFANPVYDEADGKRIGNDSGFCVRTFVGQVWQCSLTIALATPGGQLMLEGAFYDTRDSKLAVTGGVDAYLGVRGEVTRHAHNADRSEYEFTFTLIQ